jgi:hypothetical protein
VAVARALWEFASLVLEDAPPEGEPNGSPTSWGAMVRAGVEAFFTVERVRDTIVIVVAAALYSILAAQAKKRLILSPARVVIAQNLQSHLRVGVSNQQVAHMVRLLEQPGANALEQEKRILQGLSLWKDHAADASSHRLKALPAAALISVAAASKKSLGPPVEAYLAKSDLTRREAAALRHALSLLEAKSASATWLEYRRMLRRIRKSQSLGVAGLLLIVMLVVLFGNPAIIAFGVLGAVVSRLIAFFRDSTDSDQKYNWVILFLVPIVGGLSAYGGVLLVDAMQRWNLIGDAFATVTFGGESANVPTMAIAFLFGFAERLLDNVAVKAVDGLSVVTAKPGESAPADPAGETPAAEAQAGLAEQPTPAPPQDGAGLAASRARAGSRGVPPGHLPRRLRRRPKG